MPVLERLYASVARSMHAEAQQRPGCTDTALRVFHACELQQEASRGHWRLRVLCRHSALGVQARRRGMQYARAHTSVVYGCLRAVKVCSVRATMTSTRAEASRAEVDEMACARVVRLSAVAAAPWPWRRSLQRPQRG